jgi:FkbM family methyltransferase
VGGEGLVTTIEASPVNSEYIRKYLHQQDVRNIDFIHAAICDKPSTVLFGHCLCTGNSRIFENEDQFDNVTSKSTSKWEKYNVKSDTLDNLIEGKVDFLNITINSYEYSGLQGATRILDENPRMLVTFPWMGYQQSNKLLVTENNQITKVVRLLRDRGYCIVFADARQQTFVNAPFITGLAIKDPEFNLVEERCTQVDLETLMYHAEMYSDLW